VACDAVWFGTYLLNGRSHPRTPYFRLPNFLKSDLNNGFSMTFIQ